MSKADMLKITGIERSRYDRIEDGARLYFDEAKMICDALEKEFQWLSHGAELGDLKGEDLDTVHRYRKFPREWRNMANTTIRFLHDLRKDIEDNTE